MQWSDISFSRKTIRQFAGLWIVFFGGLALWQWLVLDRPLWAMALGILAVTLGPLGLYEPNWLKPIYTAWMISVFPIGWVVSLIVLLLIYLLLFTPIALWFRFRRRDILERNWDRSQGSYFHERPTVDNIQRYFKQY